MTILFTRNTVEKVYQKYYSSNYKLSGINSQKTKVPGFVVLPDQVGTLGEFVSAL